MNRSIQIFGFTNPVRRKDGLVQLDVVFGAGQAGTITATPAMWDRITGAFLVAIKPAASAPLNPQIGQQGLPKTPAGAHTPAHGAACEKFGCDYVCERLAPITKPSGSML
ncbi:MAG: hypothetical protein H2171_01135 [Opitutus sp.]|nr:hypothetical protein [Opitutus sp.]